MFRLLHMLSVQVVQCTLQATQDALAEREQEIADQACVLEAKEASISSLQQLLAAQKRAALVRIVNCRSHPASVQSVYAPSQS